jgi:hypothetical protein
MAVGFGRFVNRVFGRASGPSESGNADASSSRPSVVGGNAAALHGRAIENGYAHLDKLKPGVARQAATYVLTGQPADLPHKFEHVYGFRAKDGQSYRPQTLLRELVFASPQQLPHESLVRYLSLLDITYYEIIDRPLPGTQHPPRLARLYALNVVEGVYELRASARKEQRDEKAATLSLDQMIATMKLLGATLVDFFDVVFERKGRYSGNLETIITGFPETAGYTQKYPLAFATAMQRMSPQGRARAIRFLADQKLAREPEYLPIFLQCLESSPTSPDRVAAIPILAGTEDELLAETVAAEMDKAQASTRLAMVQILIQKGGPKSKALLQARLEKERAAQVRAAIEVAMSTSKPFALEAQKYENTASAEPVAMPVAAEDKGSYLSVTGALIVIPPVKEIDLSAELPDATAFRAEFEELIAAENQYRAERLAKNDKTWPASYWERKSLEPIDAESAEAHFQFVTQGKRDSTAAPRIHFNKYVSHAAWLKKIYDLMPVERAAAIAAATAGTASVIGRHRSGNVLNDSMKAYMKSEQADLRALELAEKQIRSVLPSEPKSVRKTIYDLVSFNGHSFHSDAYVKEIIAEFSPQSIWPYVVENFDDLKAFNSLDTSRPVLPSALALLGCLPETPAHYFQAIFEIALTAKNPARKNARALIENATDMEVLLQKALDDGRNMVRSAAAEWLADRRSPKAVDALLKRLKKEKSAAVRADLISAIRRLGGDLSSILGADVLIAEAQKGLADARVKMPSWLDLARMPAVRFLNGATAPEKLLHWWIAFAVKLKDPSATAQFGLYLDQLTADDARSFSTWLLESWIAHDINFATLQEAANKHINDSLHSRWRAEERRTGQRVSSDVIQEQLRAEILDPDMVSAIGDKGVLALACRADPAVSAQKVRAFLKNHGRRSHQAMALLDMLAGNGHPAALQVLIAAAVRLKQKSTQKHANDIVTRIAEDRGWTVDELADRTIPTAGFDEEGVLDLPCGDEGKVYTAHLEPKLTITLRNPDGRSVTALPAGEDETTAESKKLLSAAKKELKQIAEMQTQRLRDAMAETRSWQAMDWVEYFHDHPVMRQLCVRLVWEGLSSKGTPCGLFRLTANGDFIDVHHQPVALSAYDSIRLAHGALVAAEAGEAWAKHLASSEITPLFAQFGGIRKPLDVSGLVQTEIVDRKGWLSDSFTLRGIGTKLGYEKIASDGGGCSEYEKTFPKQGLIASISYTGSHAVEENIPAAVIALSFRKVRGSDHYGKAVTLSEVPPVLRAECHADYHAMAAKGQFDPAWESKTPW